MLKNNLSVELGCDDHLKEHENKSLANDKSEDVTDNENNVKQDHTHVQLPVIKQHVEPIISENFLNKKPLKTELIEKEYSISNNSSNTACETIPPTFLKPLGESLEFQKFSGRQNKQKPDRKNSIDSKEESQVTLNEVCLTYSNDFPSLQSAESKNIYNFYSIFIFTWVLQKNMLEKISFEASGVVNFWAKCVLQIKLVDYAQIFFFLKVLDQYLVLSVLLYI